jgi:hypothetical protein
MRVFIAISIVVASVSSASAQFAMDHGRAADAAQAAQAAQAASAARAAADAKAAAPGAPLLPSQQTNFYINGAGIVKVVSRTAEELKVDEAAQAAWRERCQPTVVEDRDGLRRVKYAERDCDLSRFNTAGN